MVGDYGWGLRAVDGLAGEGGPVVGRGRGAGDGGLRVGIEAQHGF